MSNSPVSVSGKPLRPLRTALGAIRMRTFGMFSAYQFTLLLRVYVVVGLQKLAAEIRGYRHLKIMVNALHLLTSNGIRVHEPMITKEECVVVVFRHSR